MHVHPEVFSFILLSVSYTAGCFGAFKNAHESIGSIVRSYGAHCKRSVRNQYCEASYVTFFIVCCWGTHPLGIFTLFLVEAHSFWSYVVLLLCH